MTVQVQTSSDLLFWRRVIGIWNLWESPKTLWFCALVPLITPTILFAAQLSRPAEREKWAEQASKLGNSRSRSWTDHKMRFRFLAFFRPSPQMHCIITSVALFLPPISQLTICLCACRSRTRSNLEKPTVPILSHKYEIQIVNERLFFIR